MGWTWITGRIWKHMSGHQGPLLKDDDEHLLNENTLAEPGTPKESTDIVVHEFKVPTSPPLSLENYVACVPPNQPKHPVLEESWIISPRPKTVIGNSIGILENVDNSYNNCGYHCHASPSSVLRVAPLYQQL
jgi:hypothetical protein